MWGIAANGMKTFPFALEKFVVSPCSVVGEVRKNVEPYINIGIKAISWLTPPGQGKQAKQSGDEGTGLPSSHLKPQNPFLA